MPMKHFFWVINFLNFNLNKTNKGTQAWTAGCLCDNTDVALEVALGAARRVVRVSQQRPLVVKLVVCQKKVYCIYQKLYIYFQNNTM
jgi:hypothetical protein